MRLALLALAALVVAAAASPPAPAPASSTTSAAPPVQVSDASRAVAAPVVSFLKKLIPDDSSIKLPNGADLRTNDGKVVSKADFVRGALTTAQSVAPEVADKAAVVADKLGKGSSGTQDKYKAAFTQAQNMASHQNQMSYTSPGGASLSSLASKSAVKSADVGAGDDAGASPWASLASAAQAQGIQVAAPQADAQPAAAQAVPLAHAPPRRAGPAP